LRLHTGTSLVVSVIATRMICGPTPRTVWAAASTSPPPPCTRAEVLSGGAKSLGVGLVFL
jgi:hypothetical protein